MSNDTTQGDERLREAMTHYGFFNQTINLHDGFIYFTDCPNGTYQLQVIPFRGEVDSQMLGIILTEDQKNKLEDTIGLQTIISFSDLKIILIEMKLIEQ